MYVKTVAGILDDMNLIPTGTTPDHSILLLDLNLSDYNIVRKDININSVTTKCNEYDKQFNVKNVPENFMTEGAAVNDVIEFIRIASLPDITQIRLDNIYEKFVNMHVTEMKRKLTPIRKSKKPFKKRQPFWNNELDELYKAASKAEKAFLEVKGTGPNKCDKGNAYRECQSQFDKGFKKAKDKYRRETELEIESMVGLSGKEMWQKIEGLGPLTKRHRNLEEILIEGKVYNDISTVLKGWETQFAKLYVGLPPDMPDYDNEFLKLVKAQGRQFVASTLDTSVLNSPVDYKEVKLAVMEAKSGKAVSVDKLPN